MQNYTKQDKPMGIVWIKSRNRFYLYYGKAVEKGGENYIDIFEPVKKSAVSYNKKYIKVYDFYYQFVEQIDADLCEFRDPMDYTRHYQLVSKIRKELTFTNKSEESFSSSEEILYAYMSAKYDPYDINYSYLIYRMVKDGIDIKNGEGNLWRLLRRIGDSDIVYYFLLSGLTYKEIIRAIKGNYLSDIMGDRGKKILEDLFADLPKEEIIPFGKFIKMKIEDIKIGTLVKDGSTSIIFRVIDINISRKYIDLMACNGKSATDPKDIESIGFKETYIINNPSLMRGFELRIIPVYKGGIPGWIPNEEYLNSVKYFKDPFNRKMLHYADLQYGDYLLFKKIGNMSYLVDSNNNHISKKSNFSHPKIYHECVRIKYKEPSPNHKNEDNDEKNCQCQRSKATKIQTDQRSKSIHIQEVYDKNTPSCIIRFNSKYYLVKYDGVKNSTKLKAYGLVSKKKELENSIRYFYDENGNSWGLKKYVDFSKDHFEFIYPDYKELKNISPIECDEMIRNTEKIILQKECIKNDTKYHHVDFRSNPNLIYLFNKKYNSIKIYNSYEEYILYKDISHDSKTLLYKVHNHIQDVHELIELNKAGYLQFIVSEDELQSILDAIYALTNKETRLYKREVHKWKSSIGSVNEIESLVYVNGLKEDIFKIVDDTEDHTDLLLMSLEDSKPSSSNELFYARSAYENGYKWKVGNRVYYNCTVVHDTTVYFTPGEILEIAEYIPKMGKLWLPTKKYFEEKKFFENKLNRLMPLHRHIYFDYNGWWLATEEPLLLTDYEPRINSVGKNGNIVKTFCGFDEGMRIPVFIRVSKH